MQMYGVAICELVGIGNVVAASASTAAILLVPSLVSGFVSVSLQPLSSNSIGSSLNRELRGTIRQMSWSQGLQTGQTIWVSARADIRNPLLQEGLKPLICQI